MEKLDSRDSENPLSLCTEHGGPHSGRDATGSDARRASTLNASGVLRHPTPEWRLTSKSYVYDSAFHSNNRDNNIITNKIILSI